MSNFKDLIEKSKQRLESNSPGNISQGGKMAKKTSYRQPGAGKQTIGGEYSSKAAFQRDPRDDIDIKTYIEKLPSDSFNTIDQYAEKMDVTIQDVVAMAINKDLSPDKLLKLIK